MTCEAARHNDTTGHCCYSADSRYELTLDARANTGPVIILTAKKSRASDCSCVSRTSCCETNMNHFYSFKKKETFSNN